MTNRVTRYEVNNGKADWEEAERTISKAAKDGKAGNLTVAVKTGEKKRKVGEAKARKEVIALAENLDMSKA
jgi:hypothetical protein